MSDTETYYLIDFENVNESGLSCTRQLDCHDHIHIFSTKNTPHISFESLSFFNSSDLDTHVVPAGNQSLDMHLISYLGYLIGKNDDQTYKYIIVSKDTNYDNIISFLNNLTSADITRQPKISSTPQAKAEKPASTINTGTKNAEPKSKTSSKAQKKKEKPALTINTGTKSAEAKQNPLSKSQFNTEIMHSMSSGGYDRITTGQVASISSKHFGSPRLPYDVRNELCTIFPHNYLYIYKTIRSVLQKFSAAEEKSSTTELNNKIQKKLSKASYEADTISYVASLVCKTNGKSNAKQTIYRELVAKYGQGKALDIYNPIKKLL